MSRKVKKIVIVGLVALISLIFAIIVDSGVLSTLDASPLILLLVSLVYLWPMLHAMIAHPDKMPFYWIIINLFFSYGSYLIFLIFLVNRNKLSLTHSKYDPVDDKIATENNKNNA